MEETLINRTMPNSREAEQSVIGSMIMDKDAILTAMEMLISESIFSSTTHSSARSGMRPSRSSTFSLLIATCGNL